jgi:acyl-CoA hydrolase
MRKEAKVSEPHLGVRFGSEVHLDEWVAPDVTDPHGLLQAGKLLEWMDVIGLVAATRHCRRPAATASIEGMKLRAPIRLGERVVMSARVAHTSSRSVGISISTAQRDERSGRPRIEAYMTFVPIDRDRRPAPVPRFWPQTPAETARFDEGELRREFRQRLKGGALERQPSEPTSGDAVGKPWPRQIREWMLRLPGALRLPWDAIDAQPARARQRSYVHKIEPVRLGTLNFHGTLYGGTLMRWSEDSARLSARAHLDGAAVRCTGLHVLEFLRPVERNRFVHIRSAVVHTAGAKVTSLISVQAEDPIAQTHSESLRALFVYAPLEPSVRVAPVECQSADERALFDEVDHRIGLEQRIEDAATRSGDAREHARS